MLSDPSSDQPADEVLIDRVRKLLDKAHGTDNPHESDAFAAKAAELVARHRLDPEQLTAASRTGDDLAIRQVHIGRGAYTRARLALLTGIADAHDVRVVFQAQSTGTVAFCAGHRTDLDVVEVMYTSLHQQAADQMARIKRQTGAATQQFRRSFLFGFAGRIAELLAEARRSVEDQRRATTAEREPSIDLVLRERSQRVDDFARREWGRVRSATRVAPIGSAGWQRGTEAADRADVGRTRLSGRRALGRGD